MPNAPMTRLFTVEHANRMLPLVRRIVEDLVTTHERWREAMHEFEVASATSRADLPDERALVLQVRVQDLAREIEGYVAELSQLGVEFKGFEVGLVDFPSELDGEEIHLCWQLGETSVGHWHRRTEGFAGRKPL